jgi:hypothetical protein
MIQLTPAEVKYLQDLVNSLQYETSKAKDNGGWVCPTYIKEKVNKITKLTKTK